MATTAKTATTMAPRVARARTAATANAPTIAASVGSGGANREADVRTVQALLNRHAPALGIAPLALGGRADAATIAAIRRAQARLAGLSLPDGRVDPGGRTRQVLAGAPPLPAGPDPRLSGAAWWRAHQARFPNSSAVADLEPAFAAQVDAFIAALRAAGAVVQVSATRRNRVRAYLMHWCWKVSSGVARPAEVPAEAGCDIVWDHGDGARSRRGAKEMAELFGIVFQPSLTSRHILGLAVDMTIGWNGTISVRDAAGRAVRLDAPAGNANPLLHAVGAGYGVRKLLSDPPHWSDNGH